MQNEVLLPNPAQHVNVISHRGPRREWNPSGLGMDARFLQNSDGRFHIAEHLADDDPYEVFAKIEQLAHQLAGLPAPYWQPPDLPHKAPPRLTEDWFC